MCSGPISAMYSSKSPGWGSGSVQGSFFLRSVISDHPTLMIRRIPAGDNEPVARVGRTFDHQSEHASSARLADDHSPSPSPWPRMPRIAEHQILIPGHYGQHLSFTSVKCTE